MTMSAKSIVGSSKLSTKEVFDFFDEAKLAVTALALEGIIVSKDTISERMSISIHDFELKHSNLGGRLKKELRLHMETMCKERDAKFFVVPNDLSGDNGTMIAYTGILNKDKKFDSTKIDRFWRTDDVEI